MLAGISTASFYPATTEQALRRIADAGVKAAEVFINSFSELEAPYLRELRAIAGETKLLSVHPFTSGLEPLLFFSDYDRRRQDGVEFYKRFFDAANQLGASIVVFHGNRRESIRSRSEYFELFSGLLEAGRAMGVTVAQENVPRCQSWEPDFFREMAHQLPEARFVLDVKQALRSGFSPLEMVDAMGARICHLHLSDHDAQQDCLPIGKGTLDLVALLMRLEAYDFDGGVVLELYRDNYGSYDELFESCHLVEQTIRELQNLRQTTCQHRDRMV